MRYKYKKQRERILTKAENNSGYIKESTSGEYVAESKDSKTFNLRGKEIKLELLHNIQFIYELALAKLELQTLGGELKISNDFRTFKINSSTNLDGLKKRLAYFESIDGDFTNYYSIIKYNRTHSTNQYLTHWFYPYKGKFHPQMIRALLNIMQIKSGELVLDPFVGSGTAAVESQLLGINFIGIDISPLCVLISKVKTESLNIIDEIEKYKDKFTFGIEPSLDLNYKQNTLFTEFSGDGSINKIKNIKVKNFFKLAEMIAHSDNSRRGRDFQKSFNLNIIKMLETVKDYKIAQKQLGLTLGKVSIYEGDAQNLDLEDASIDGIITSPPYSIALNYVANDAHALKALGYDLEKIKDKFIGVKGSGLKKFELYNDDMHRCTKEMYRVLKKNKYCVIIIGNITFQGNEVDTTQMIINYCIESGFEFKKKIEKIIFGLYNVMQKEYILIFRKVK